MEVLAWHTLAPGDVASRLRSGPEGLSEAEAAQRITRVGPNEVEEIRARGDLAILRDQLRSPFAAILVGAAVLAGYIGDLVDTAAILLVVVIDVAVGFFQERHGERSLLALRRLSAQHALVLRDGREMRIPSRLLVPGDLVPLESGVRVPADIRLVSSRLLVADESLLTGESEGVRKHASALGAVTPLVDRTNMLYAGTTITSGRGRGYVVATGRATELGAIVEEIRGVGEQQTPLQRSTRSLAAVLGIASLALATAVALVTVARGGAIPDALLVAVSVAVAAIPEGLPVALTIVLAVGTRRMAHRNAIVRRLAAVETLGCTTVIGADKTGTLTENRMTVVDLWTPAGSHALSELSGQRRAAGGAIEALVADVLRASVLANEATARPDDGGVMIVGEPTDAALLRAASDLGLDVSATRRELREVAAIPFEPERRYAASVRERDGDQTLFVKGAPERVLSFCTAMRTADGDVPLRASDVLEAASRMGRVGLRVIAMASRRLDRPIADQAQPPEPGALVLLGLEGMRDPPRRGVPEAIAECRRAGIRVLMVTGDHAETARSIGQEVGIASPDDRLLTGADLERMEDDDLGRAVFEVPIYARTSPEDKLRIVRALQERSAVVAITGDGVNDAPALKAADVGVAMGRGGTDVAREAADIVLADDNFVSIVAAVREGRISFANLRNVTFFLVSSNIAEILAVLAAAALGWPLLLLPVQILWLNLATEGLQDVALVFEPGEPDVAARPPRARREPIISSLLWERALISGAVMTVGTLALFRFELDAGASLQRAQAVAVTTLVLFQTLHLGNSRSERLSIFEKSPWANPFLFLSTGAAFVLHALALYTPLGQGLLELAPLDLEAWIRIVAVSSTIVVAVELHKRIRPP